MATDPEAMVVLVHNNCNCIRRDLIKGIICLLTLIMFDSLECTIYIEFCLPSANAESDALFSDISPEEPVDNPNAIATVSLE